MTLLELKQYIDHILKAHEDAGNTLLVVKVKKPSVGPISTEPINRVCLGFDWEKGLFILYPEKDLKYADI